MCAIKRYVGDKFVGLSSDSKPTAIADGAIFYESDTGKIFHKISGTWTQINPLSGFQVQMVNIQTGEVATGTTVIPLDNSIPQKTEGDEYMTLAITPKKSMNKLKIDIVVFLSSSYAGVTALIAALFQDDTDNALAAMAQYAAGQYYREGLKFTHYMTAGTTSSTTFKVRCGGGNAGTTTFNGGAGVRDLGGVLASSITITEIEV